MTGGAPARMVRDKSVRFLAAWMTSHIRGDHEYTAIRGPVARRSVRRRWAPMAVSAIRQIARASLTCCGNGTSRHRECSQADRAGVWNAARCGQMARLLQRSDAIRPDPRRRYVRTEDTPVLGAGQAGRHQRINSRLPCHIAKINAAELTSQPRQCVPQA